MNPSDPPNTSSDTEPATAAITDVDAAAVRLREGLGVAGFVVSAYEAHHAEVFAYLARATRDPSVAADLLQETYGRLAKEAHDGHAPLQVRGWLYRVATNLAMSSSRRQTTAQRWLGRNGQKEREGMTAPSPEAGVPGEERAADLERALEGLSADARLALLLSGVGFAGEEIAEAIGRSAAATRTLLCRARTRVRVRRDLFAGEAR